MKVKSIPSTWISRDGLRLDCNPYMSGALEARIRLEELSCRKEMLADLTKGYEGGIYNGPHFSRNYVDGPKHGVPFLGSSSMLKADLSNLPFLRRKDAESTKLSHLQIEPGMTLISCSGTIGRMVYARPDMSEMWSSQHIMKVVPNEAKVLSGYLFAFLSSKFGVPLVTSGTYGSIIQSIEPEHIAGLPVPRMGDKIEREIHQSVERSAYLLDRYQEGINSATEQVFCGTHIPNPTREEWFSDTSDLAFAVQSSELHVLRAWNHSRRANAIRHAIKRGDYSLLGEVVSHDWLKWRVMFKRIDAQGDHGIEVITQRPLFALNPEGRWVSRAYLLGLSEKYLVPDRTTLIAKQGTLGEQELYCRCEYVTGERMLKRAYSDHCMRIVADPARIHPGYLFAFLRSSAGFRLLRSVSEGAKQQDLHWLRVPKIPIPRKARQEESAIGQLVDSAYQDRIEALVLLQTARAKIESAIEGAS